MKGHHNKVGIIGGGLGGGLITSGLGSSSSVSVSPPTPFQYSELNTEAKGMQDVLITADNDGLYDIRTYEHDFASAGGFETAIPVSYFTDSRASESVVQEARSRRGWVGNLRTVDTGRELGGLLWLLDQARMMEETLNLGRSYADNSLAWMIEDSVAKQITVQVEQTSDREFNILTDIKAIDDTVTKYVTLWRNTNFQRILP